MFPIPQRDGKSRSMKAAHPLDNPPPPHRRQDKTTQHLAQNLCLDLRPVIEEDIAAEHQIEIPEDALRRADRLCIQ